MSLVESVPDSEALNASPQTVSVRWHVSGTISVTLGYILLSCGNVMSLVDHAWHAWRHSAVMDRALG
jgi:hypothetical protein